MGGVVHAFDATGLLETILVVEDALRFVRAVKQQPRQLLEMERRTHRRLRDLFGSVFERIIGEFEALDRVPSEATMRRRMLAPLSNLRDQYAETLFEESDTAIQYARNRIVAQLQRAGISVAHRDVSEFMRRRLATHIFRASERTLHRMVGDVMGTLSDAFDAGLGIPDAADLLRRDFLRMEDFELERIARTEINTMQNRVAHETEVQLGVEYEQWWTADDERVRGDVDPARGTTYPEAEFDHTAMHGQITRVGDRFVHPTQGWSLRYPTDRDGELGNIINCRCHAVAFVMPEGKMPPPGEHTFYEGDLIDVSRNPHNPKVVRIPLHLFKHPRRRLRYMAKVPKNIGWGEGGSKVPQLRELLDDIARDLQDIFTAVTELDDANRRTRASDEDEEEQ